MSFTPTCAECDEPMETGVLPVFYGPVSQIHWQPGAVTDNSATRHLRADQELMFPVTTYRCPKCGLLKMVANK